jgi:hypothetical protein
MVDDNEPEHDITVLRPSAGKPATTLKNARTLASTPRWPPPEKLEKKWRERL